MLIAIGVMFVTGLLLVAAFTAGNGDVHLSHQDTVQKQAYYAALAGIQEFEYQLQADPDYWESCPTPKSTLPEEANDIYEDVILPANGSKECESSNPFSTAITAKGRLENTFRIESTGKVKDAGYNAGVIAAAASRSIVATFKVTGFLDYIYYTNYETLDPGLNDAPPGCKGAYYKEWSLKGAGYCQSIVFTTGDSVNGPMHTNDAARVEGAAKFGREGQVPPDEIEINGGTWPSASCSGSAKYFTATGCYNRNGPTLVPPEQDTSLATYVNSADSFSGVTKLVLNGTSNTIKATYYKEVSGKLEPTEATIPWPENGLIYVHASPLGCNYPYEPENNDDSSESERELGCGNVYVQGSYSKSLTIAGESDLIITGNIYPTSVSGSLGSEPTGTAVLGLIASHYVRVYHPLGVYYAEPKFGCGSDTLNKVLKECQYTNNESSCDAPNLTAAEDPNGLGTLTNLWVYAAILSTSHSFLADNWKCGVELGKLHVYGAIAQDYRGPVGLVGTSGYLKDYKYDGRLATDEPPYYLAPLKAGWKIIRETAPAAG